LRLRTHINLIVGCLSAAFLTFVVSIEVDSTRRAVQEEIFAANAVASQLLGKVAESDSYRDAQSLRAFLESLGRVRANEISLYGAGGELIYKSPTSTYKAGREAPQWFLNLLLPTTAIREFASSGGSRLVVSANASRAILDGWDAIIRLALGGVVALSILNGFVFWLVGRALAPLPVIASGLGRLQHGELDYRLPALPGFETGIIGTAFNDMAMTLQNKVQAERQAREAEARLEERTEFSKLIEQRIEEERRMIARELHDEFAQSVTAIRSLAVAIGSHVPDVNSPVHNAAQVISSEAARLYDSMHGLIPRLAPLALDTLGLSETLQGLVDEWQRRHPTLKLTLRQNLPNTLGQSVALTLYRIVQEALINALRHARPTKIDVEIACDAHRVVVKVIDNGVGLPPDWMRPGRFGLRGLRERAEHVHGTLTVSNRDSIGEGHGVEVRAEIPLEVAA
jgi:two-component system, NarL family, sensor histidine kinase UhpB